MSISSILFPRRSNRKPPTSVSCPVSGRVYFQPAKTNWLVLISRAGKSECQMCDTWTLHQCFFHTNMPGICHCYVLPSERSSWSNWNKKEKKEGRTGRKAKVKEWKRTGKMLNEKIKIPKKKERAKSWKKRLGVIWAYNLLRNDTGEQLGKEKWSGLASEVLPLSNVNHSIFLLWVQRTNNKISVMGGINGGLNVNKTILT